jgi:hypothetical protein
MLSYRGGRYEFSLQVQTDEGHDWYMGKVQKWEDDKNKSNGKRVAPCASVKKATTVTARSSSYMQARKFFGNLWPVALYRKHFNKKPTNKQLSSHMVDGKPVRGVLLPRSAGELIPGVIELWGIGETGADKTAVIADGSELAPEEVDAAFETAQKRQRIIPATTDRRRNRLQSWCC